MIGCPRLCSGVLAACLLAVAPARADLIYELSPSAGAGAADNVTATGQHYGDTFTLVGGTARLQYRGLLVTHALSYGLIYSKYMQGRYPDTLANSLSWLSTITASPLWTLQLGATGTLARSSGIDLANAGTFAPQSVVAGSAHYLTTQATEGLELHPSARWKFNEGLTVGYVRYLDYTINGMAAALPRTVVVTLSTRGEREVGRDAFSGEVDAADTSTTYEANGAAPRPEGEWLIGRALAGWRHELSPVWSTSLQAGPAITYQVHPPGTGVLAPAAIASLNYNRVPWYASLTATQTPMANAFLGAAILADEAIVRLAVPLTRNERLVVSGFGGYVYARIADANGSLARAYDQLLGGLSLGYKVPNVPLSALANYTVVSQRGGSAPGFPVAGFAYQYVFITLRSDLVWGKGTPALFSEPSDQVRGR
jgi:hypothetical protein